jgi:membrane protein DedA with SNARE-associated domain
MTEFLERSIDTLGYLGVLLMMYLEYVLPILPTQVVIPIAGVMVGRGELTFLGVWISGILGAALGSQTIYEVGRHIGSDNLERFIMRYGRYLTITPSHAERAARQFERYGSVLVILSHMTPLSPLRLMTSLYAGIAGMPRVKAFAYAVVGSIPWIGVQLYAATLIGENWTRLWEEATRYQVYLWIIGGVVAAGFIVWYLWRLRQSFAVR